MRLWQVKTQYWVEDNWYQEKGLSQLMLFIFRCGQNNCGHLQDFFHKIPYIKANWLCKVIAPKNSGLMDFQIKPFNKISLTIKTLNIELIEKLLKAPEQIWFSNVSQFLNLCSLDKSSATCLVNIADSGLHLYLAAVKTHCS